MKVAIFGGSFDPVHREHVRLVRSAIQNLGLDRVIVMPSYQAPHKTEGAHVSGEDRLEMCRLAFRGEERVQVSGEEIDRGGTSYTYLTCRKFVKDYPGAERFFLVGADMLENFFEWKNPEEILSCVTLAACGRGEEGTERLRQKFFRRFHTDFVKIPFVGDEVSSSRLRVSLAFRDWVKTDLSDLDGVVLGYIQRKRLYDFPQAEALGLEKPSRREHSYRVAKLACAKAKEIGVSEEDALLSSMLHDCGKYLARDDLLLSGLELPGDVSEPVVHQFAGAFLAEKKFGVRNEDVLNAIRYHTSGRAGMSALEKLIFLADMLEEGRSYEGVELLRALFWRNFEKCFLEALRRQILYLSSTGKEIYPSTLQAYEWECKNSPFA